MRRDRDPRPPVEVIGAAEPEGSLQTIELGGARRASGRGRAVAALLALVIVGGLVLGSDGSDGGGAEGSEDAASPLTGRPAGERDNSHKLPDRTTSTTDRDRETTTTAPSPSPVIEGSTARLVLIGRGPVEVLELGSGESTELNLQSDVFGVLPAEGGLVAVDSGAARFHPLPSGEPVVLGSADYVLDAADAGEVWLIQGSSPYDGSAATLVDLGGRVIAGPIPLSGWAVGAAGDGLLIQAGGRIFEVAVDGDVRPLTSGDALGVSEGRLFAHICDDEAVCSIAVLDPDLRRSRRIEVPDGAGSRFGATVAVQPGGHLAAMQLYTESGTEVAVIDLEGGPHRLVPDVSFVSNVAWLPGDGGLLLARSSEVLRVYERGDKLMVEQLLDRGADQIAVIPR